MIRLSALVLATFVAGAFPLHAQSASGLQAGAKVRLHVVGQPTISGVLLGPVRDSVRLSAVGGSRAISLGELRRMSVSAGRESVGRSMLRKGGIGALAGLLGGVILGFADGDDDPRGWFAMSASEKAAVGGVFLGGVGFVGGSIVGLATRGERWESAPVTTRLGLI